MTMMFTTKFWSDAEKDFEPKYKEEFEKQYELVYHSLRDNVIATIHGEIKAAYRHRRQINKMLSQDPFSDSIYQIDIFRQKMKTDSFMRCLWHLNWTVKCSMTTGLTVR